MCLCCSLEICSENRFCKKLKIYVSHYKGVNSTLQANFYISNLFYSPPVNELVAGIFLQPPDGRNGTQQIIQTIDTFVTKTMDHILQEKKKIWIFPWCLKIKNLTQQSFLTNANHSLQSNKLKTPKINLRGYLLWILFNCSAPP